MQISKIDKIASRFGMRNKDVKRMIVDSAYSNLKIERPNLDRIRFSQIAYSYLSAKKG
jgi:hypothetical protein